MNHVTCIFAFLLAVLAAQATADCPDTNQPCKHCGPGARCTGAGRDRRCVCREGLSSRHPDFNCFDHETSKSCYFVWDPSVKSFGNETAPFDFIGSTKLVDVTTTNPKRPFGTCHFELWGWTQKYQGKLYIAGLGFKQSISFDRGQSHQMEGEVNGQPDGCDYNYDAYMWRPGNNPFSANPLISVAQAALNARKPWECGVTITTTKGNFLQAVSPCCGVEFGLRNFHPEYPNRIPGMYAVVSDRFNPDYNIDDNAQAPICLDGEKEVEYKDLVDSNDVEGKKPSLTYQAITNSDYADYENAPANLPALKSALSSCSDPNEVFQRADAMFRNAHFIRCSSSTDAEYISVLTDTVNYICNDDAASCAAMKAAVEGNCPAGKIDAIPGLRALVDSC